MKTNHLLVLLAAAITSIAAINHDGTDDFITTPLTDFSQAAGTITWWSYPTATNATRAMWGQMTSGNVNPALTAQKFTDGNLYVGWARSADDDRCIVAVGNYFPINTWTHYAFTWTSGGTSIFYVNGSAVKTNAGGTTVNNIARAMVVGRQGDAISVWFTGKTSEWACWSVALSSSEVSQIANGRVRYLPTQIQPSSLRAYYPLDDFADGVSATGSNTLLDRGSAGAHATPSGSPTARAEEVLASP